MQIPTPNEYAKDHGHNPFPPRWERWLSAARAAILSAQPTAGRHVSVDEHPGKGTVINIDDTSARRPTGGGGGPILGACCYNDGTCDDLTEGDCTDAGGNWQGPDTTCDDDPNPCVGACCEGEGGTTCVENSTPDSCAADGGTFQDFGSTCDPNPCSVDCGGCTTYLGFLGTHSYQIQTVEISESVSCGENKNGGNSFFKTTFIDPDTCVETCSDAGGTSDCDGCDGGMPCHKDYSCDGWPDDFNTCFGLFDDSGLGWCTCANPVVVTNMSDTVQIATCDKCAGCPDTGSSSYTQTITLSGMCAP